MKLRQIRILLIGTLSLTICVFLSRKIHSDQQPITPVSKTFDKTALKDMSNIIPVAVIGAGPAGLSAALFTSREQYQTVVFQGPKVGGQLGDTVDVENWPGILRQKGSDIMKTMEQQVQKFGTLLLPETITHVNFATWPFTLYSNNNHEYKALSVVIATGAWPRKLNVPGEEKYWGKGVAICTQCDAAFTKDQDVIIVGGGNTALQHAFHLIPHTRKITIITNQDSLSADNTLKAKLATEYPDIAVFYNTQPKQIIGNDQRVTGLEIEETGKKRSTRAASWIFLAIGYEPNSSVFKGHINLDSKGIIQVAPYTQATSVPGIYAAGKVANAIYKLGAIASGEGIKAGLDAVSFLEKKGLGVEALKTYQSQLYQAPKMETAQPEQPTPSVEIPQIQNQDELQKLLDQSALPVALEFFSPKCPHCLAMQPIVEKIAAQFAGKTTIAQSNILKSESLMEAYNVMSIPTFVVFQDKKEKTRTTGQISQEDLATFISQAIQA